MTPTASTFRREVDLVPPVRAFLEARGYRVQDDPDRTGFFDIAAVRGDEIGLVELKLHASGAVFQQGWIISESVGRASMASGKIGNILGVRVAAAALFCLLWWWLRGTRSQWPPLIVSAGLLIASISILPASFKQARALGSDLDAREFSDWSSAIPPDSTVFVAPTRDVGSFVWFTLRRPNYLALDQSAGVVFSRATALEIRRRSLVLLPLTDPTWKILSGIRRHAAKLIDTAPTRPLTADSLVQVCSDPRLGFVVSPENVGFDALRHKGEGAWKDWNLYDCRRARK